MKKQNYLALIVVLIVIIEGIAIYLNMVAHPKSQPGLTIFIVLLMALIFGLAIRYRFNQQTGNDKVSITKITRGSFKYGLGFWIGGGIYSLINMLMNLNQAPQSKILIYNIVITGVAILGFILNLILLKKSKK